MREHHQRIVDGDLGKRNVIDAAGCLPVRHRGQPARERFERERGSTDRERLQRLSSRQHEDDQCPREIFPEDHRTDDGNAREQIGVELEA